VAGGAANSSTGHSATVGGGALNTSSGYAATVGGGRENAASGDHATVPGGYLNAATTNLAFAAGSRAKANHIGAFVWADSQVSDFASTEADQFIIRASGGVGIGTAVTPVRLTVAGSGAYNSSSAAALLLTNTTSGTGRAWEWHALNNGRLQLADFTAGETRLLVETNGNFGIGRGAPVNMLEVEGDASKTTAGSWLANSDARIKQEIQPVTGALEKLAQVRLVNFRYTADYRAQHPAVEDRRYLNVVAQEFREVFPEHVKSSGEKLADGSEILQVDTYPLTIYSAAAIQELNQELKRRDAENAELKRELGELKQLVGTLAGKLNGGPK
jgi:Chaperone of endosialidase